MFVLRAKTDQSKARARATGQRLRRCVEQDESQPHRQIGRFFAASPRP